MHRNKTIKTSFKTFLLLAFAIILTLSCSKKTEEIERPHSTGKLDEKVRDSRTVTVGLDHWPPFGIEQSNNPGISAEIIKTAYNRAGLTVELVFLPWPRVEESARDLKVDVVGNLYKIPSLEEWMHYSDHYLISKVSFASGRDFNREVKLLADLKEENIGLGIGYSFGKEFDEADYLKKTEVQKSFNALKMLEKGRVSLVIDSEEVLKYFFKSEPRFKSSLKILPYIVSANEMCVGVNRKHPDKENLIKLFNENLKEMIKDGTVNKIISKYISD